MDNDPKHTSKLVTKCFKDNKGCQSGHHKALISVPREFVGSTEKVSDSKKAYKPDPVTPVLSLSEPRFQKTIEKVCGRKSETFG